MSNHSTNRPCCRVELYFDASILSRLQLNEMLSVRIPKGRHSFFSHSYGLNSSSTTYRTNFTCQGLTDVGRASARFVLSPRKWLLLRSSGFDGSRVGKTDLKA